MPDMSLRLSDFRIPALVSAALFAGVFVTSEMVSTPSGLNAGTAVPGEFLSKPAEPDVMKEAVKVSKRPKARPDLIPLHMRADIRLGGIACLEQARKPTGQPVTYISRNCLWYSGIDQSVYPEECSTVFGGVDGGRKVFEVSCLIRVGFWQDNPRTANNG